MATPDFDVRNRFVFSTVWNEPYFKSGKGFKAQVLGGWIVSPIFTARSGVPFNVSDSTNSINVTTGPYGIPRYTPSSSNVSGQTGSGVSIGPNNLNLLTLPTSVNWTGLLGVSDFGPYPASMV